MFYIIYDNNICFGLIYYDSYNLTIHIHILIIFEFLSLGTPKSQKSRKPLYFLYLHKINIFISKICKKKSQGEMIFLLHLSVR